MAVGHILTSYAIVQRKKTARKKPTGSRRAPRSALAVTSILLVFERNVTHSILPRVQLAMCDDRVCYGNFSKHKRTQRKHMVWSTECGGYAGTPPTPHPCPHREIPTIQPSYFFPNATMRTQSHAVAAPGFEPGCRRDPLAAARRAPSAPRAARCCAAAMRAAAPPAAPPCSPLPRSPPHPSPEATHPTPRPPTLLRPRLPSRPPVAAALPLLRRAVEHLPPTRTHVWSGGGHALRGGWKRGAAYLDEQFNDLLRSATSAESPQMIADGRGRSPLETDPGRRSDHGLPAVQMPPR